MENFIDMPKSTMIRHKTKELQNSMLNLSENLPPSLFYGLNDSLVRTARNLTDTKIEDGFHSTNRIDQIRSFIKANGSLEEAKDYLNLVEQLKYSDTKHLISLINELSALMANSLNKKDN